MQPQTLVFIGPSGSGKGTQAKQVTTFLEDRTNKSVLYVETGANFRGLANTETTTAKIITSSMQAGDIQPTFLATHLWAREFINKLSSDMHLVIDGSPRRMLEAKLLDEAFRFYERRGVTAIHLTLSEATTHERLESRDRADDKPDSIEHRLAQFKAETLPTADFYENNDRYNYAQIDAEQSIENIQKDIQAILLSND
jgi:adenylate kinase